MDKAFEIIPENGKNKFLYNELKDKVLYKSEHLPVIGNTIHNKRDEHPTV